MNLIENSLITRWRTTVLTGKAGLPFAVSALLPSLEETDDGTGSVDLHMDATHLPGRPGGVGSQVRGLLPGLTASVLVRWGRQLLRPAGKAVLHPPQARG